MHERMFSTLRRKKLKGNFFFLIMIMHPQEDYRINDPIVLFKIKVSKITFKKKETIEICLSQK